MLWTVIGYQSMEGIESVPYLNTFYGSHNAKMALEDAIRLLKLSKTNVKVIAVVAGNHVTSTYIYEP